MSAAKKRKVFLDAYELSAGNVSHACKGAGISRQTYYNWLDKFDTFKKGIAEIDEATKDFAESILMKMLQEKNVTATIFYLKTKCKDRGYVEKVELELPKEYVPVQMVLPDNGRVKKHDKKAG